MLRPGTEISDGEMARDGQLVRSSIYLIAIRAVEDDLASQVVHMVSDPLGIVDQDPVRRVPGPHLLQGQDLAHGPAPREIGSQLLYRRGRSKINSIGRDSMDVVRPSPGADSSDTLDRGLPMR